MPLLVRRKGLKPSHKITKYKETFIQMCNKIVTHIQLITFLEEIHYLDAC
jgi:hypothetical protein